MHEINIILFKHYKEKMDQTVDPAGNLKLTITQLLSNLVQSHVKYQYSLSLWKRYLIWLYTTGSSSHRYPGNAICEQMGISVIQ